ncbi:hypothetical protein ASPZODRAFT_142798 [Penicilliopsis zonata CBS 506.65]|uniref:Catalase core domain-containing protein n=1 Tax=Penicilliopsis zonata CBS 506.65 TaxID=1073090 RepID=A0A1L9SFX1_9EURO|nr:hypothetical protein ASPZODRAFT_142798 [Penicilliopsis zonata CBS 506.65]OJJ46175.1 hypothetical protein ASPZODRAFT_142798 [Penicilliopsis zonata CBS 506.65]
MTGGLQHPIDYAVISAKMAMTPAPATDNYLPWNTPGVENIGPDEPQKVEQLKAVMARMQQHNFDKHRHCFRATHVKTLGVVKGKLKVREDLPTELRQGVFHEPGREYDVIARYANEPYLLLDDKEATPRGLALKVFGVDGERLEGVENKTMTQDFFFNNAPMIELTNLDTTLDIMTLREKNFDNPTALSAALKLRTDAIKQHAPYQLPNTNVISHSLFSQSAFGFGPWYGHMALFPANEQMKMKSNETVTKDAASGTLGNWLSEHFKDKEARYEFKIQLGTSALHHPTEDASIVWDQTTAPYQTLAVLSFPPQDSLNHARRTFWEDRMSLDPWRGLAAHRPLGSINRLRREVYYHSKEIRDRINATESKDVTSIDDIP